MDPNGAYSHLINLQARETGRAGTEQRVANNNSSSSQVADKVAEGVSSSSRRFVAFQRNSSSKSSDSSRSAVSISRLNQGATAAVVAGDVEATTDGDHHKPEPVRPPKSVLVRRLANLHKPEVPVLVVGSIAATICGTILPVYGVLLSTIIKTFYEGPHQLQKDARFWAVIYIIVAVISSLATPARTYFFGLAGCRLVRRIRIMVFQKVLCMEMGWFDHPDNSSGAIGARLSADAAAVRGLVGDSLSLLVQNMASAVAGLVIAFEASWELALIMLAILPLIGLSGYAQVKFMQGFSADAKVRTQIIACLYI